MQQNQSNKLEVKKNINPNLKPSIVEPLFKGRINREQFVTSSSFIFAANFLISSYSQDDFTFLIIVLITTGIMQASLTVERLHDLGRPGSHFWLLLIPVYNIIFFISELVIKKGQIGENKYGVDPTVHNKKLKNRKKRK